MVTYCYTTDDGQTVEYQCRMGQAPESVFSRRLGRLAARDLVAEHGGQRSGDPWVNHASMALAVHPDDKRAHEAAAAASGVPTEFRVQGDLAMPVFTSRSHQKKYCKAHGYTNYGDTW